jgi:iron(III) transport system substrate-binding protein
MLLRSRALLAAAALALAATTAGCSGSDPQDEGLVLYNAQNRTLMEALTRAFTEQTGIPVAMRNGGDSELSNQLVEEGDKSPADVFTTENSTAMAQVDRADLFAPLPDTALAGVPPQHVSARRTWVGVAARSTVLVYNPSLLAEADLPRSMLDLEQPQWKGRFGYAPTGADFQAIASAVYAIGGDQVGDRFVQGLKDNGTAMANNIAILKAVDAGQVPAGIIYHYYWFQDQARTGQDSDQAKLHYFGNQDPGAYLSIAGAGVLASSKRSEKAQQFVAFLTSRQGQEVLAGSNDLQYAIDNGVASNPALKPLAELQAPAVPFDRLDGAKVQAAMRRVGIL